MAGTANIKSNLPTFSCPKSTSDAVVNFMALKMIVEFEEGADVKETMAAVLKNCKAVEDDCEIYL